VQPAPQEKVAIEDLSFRMVSYLRFTGIGGSMTIGGLDLDPVDGDPSWSHHLTFDHITWAGGAIVRTRGANQAILFDSSVFDNLPPPLYDGRVTVRGYDNTQPVGVTISNNRFSGGCSDGVQVIGDAYGVQIGPGNEFTGLTQTGCGEHVDPIQLYGSRYTVIDGNYFHHNGDGSGGIMAPDGGDHERITNNVFVADEYPYVLQIGSHTGGLIAHNTFVGGSIEIAGHKDGESPSTGQMARDNIFTGDLRTPDPGNTEDYNLCRRGETNCKGAHDVKGSPVFVGGAFPTSRAGFKLAPGSPGRNAASDGSDIGIRVPG
jgi:hypothetical protein